MATNNSTNGVIKRAVKEVKYAQIDNDLINNRELSFKALGIMTYILSKPTDWEVYISDLCRDKDGEKSVRAGLKELIEKNICKDIESMIWKLVKFIIGKR